VNFLPIGLYRTETPKEHREGKDIKKRPGKVTIGEKSARGRGKSQPKQGLFGCTVKHVTRDPADVDTKSRRAKEKGD